MRVSAIAGQKDIGRTDARHGSSAARQMRARPNRSFSFFWRRGAAGLGICGLIPALALWNSPEGNQSRSFPPPAAPSPAWIEISRPREIIALEAPEPPEGKKVYAAWRHQAGGGRKDVLELSGTAGNPPRLRLVLYRRGTESSPEQPFYVDLVRQAAESGWAVTRAAQPSAMATRFGAFEAAELGFFRPGSPGRECLGFRFLNAAPELRMTGFACGGPASKAPAPSKPELACLVDRVELAPTADDADLVWFFAAHEIGRDPTCPKPAASKRDDTAAIVRRGNGRD